MACAAAITQLTRCIFRVRVLVLLVWPRLVIIRVTSGTVRLEGRGLPDDGVRVVLVTFRALQITTMVQRLECQADMLVDVRNPCVRIVADVAVLGCDEVALVLTGRGNAVMAGGAGADYLSMIDRYGWSKRRSAVTVFAHICRQDMLRPLTGRVDPVMAANAIIQDIDVIEIGRRPRNRRMTVIAIVAAGDMGWVFAFRDDSVVA